MKYKEKDSDMTKAFKEYADAAKMTEADRIAHAATWDAARNAALEEAARQCEDIYSWRGAYTAGRMYTNTLNACAEAIRALATE